MKQVLIFIVGVFSMFIAMAGLICGIQAVATGIGFLVLCGILFMIVWTGIVVDWFKNKRYLALVDKMLGGE